MSATNDNTQKQPEKRKLGPKTIILLLSLVCILTLLTIDTSTTIKNSVNLTVSSESIQLQKASRRYYSKKKPKRSFTNTHDDVFIELYKTCADTDNAYTDFRVISPKDNIVPFHHHLGHAETIVVERGRVNFEVVKNSSFYNPVNMKKMHYNLTVGESLTVGADEIHNWYTGKEEGVTFMVRFSPCMDGFHEGLELISNSNGTVFEGGISEIFRVLAVLQEMMETEVHDSWLSPLFHWLFRGWVQTDDMKIFRKEMRERFLPYLEDPAAPTGASHKDRKYEL